MQEEASCLHLIADPRPRAAGGAGSVVGSSVHPDSSVQDSGFKKSHGIGLKILLFGAEVSLFLFCFYNTEHNGVLVHHCGS